ncbi:MAG: hypothetical protein IPH45_17465 [Bacteroidales bacterium]|nr:hypothetical protein [Bacteroidales bacterium]
MKIKSLHLLEFISLILVVISVSCSKDQDINKNVVSTIKKGSLYGSIKMYNKYGNLDSNFTDVTIVLKDSLNIGRFFKPDSLGTFSVDSIAYGNASIIVTKPGYGIVDTLSFYIHKSIDTISTIKMAEILPFSYNSFSINYYNGFIHYSRATNYQSTDSYLVGELICFGKKPTVSINECDFLFGTGSFSNVSYINWTIGSSTNCSLINFTNSVLK